MKKVLVIPFLFSILFLKGCSPTVTRSYIDPEDHSFDVEANVDIMDEEAFDEAVTVIESNLEYAEEEDIEGYLSTVASQGHEDTRLELESFFEDYDLEHTILSITLLDQEDDLMLIEVEQQTIATYVADDAEDYRDHVSVANHTFEREDNHWKITETIMTETFFID